jgi:hypothetical protein
MGKFKKISCCLLLLVVMFFLGSCQSGENRLGYEASFSRIRKMRPIKITIVNGAKYKQYFLEGKRPEKDSNAPIDWVEITDINQIDMIMSAISKQPLRKDVLAITGECDKGRAIVFEDGNGKIEWTALIMCYPGEILYLSHGIYGGETYHTLAKFLKKAEEAFYKERMEYYYIERKRLEKAEESFKRQRENLKIQTQPQDTNQPEQNSPERQ